MFEVAGQQEQAGVLGQRGNRNIGKAGVATLRDGGIGYLPGQAGRLRVQRQDALGVTGQQAIKPAVKPVGTLEATGAAQFADALRDLGNGNGGQKKGLVVRLQPIT